MLEGDATANSQALEALLKVASSSPLAVIVVWGIVRIARAIEDSRKTVVETASTFIDAIKDLALAMREFSAVARHGQREDDEDRETLQRARGRDPRRPKTDPLALARRRGD